ncbi:MAG: restriction endonuclease subunit S, partial [Thiotrichaceae bacterium]
GLRPFYTGLRKVVRAETFANIEIPVPSISEQTKISSFLDHETAKIDTLIEQQQQLIQLLKEKRQALISHAVTKGLNPNALMKDSGVEWLGEVPAHWELPKIKWFCKTESGGTPNTGKYEEYYLDGEVPWIRTTDLNNNDLMDTPIKITQKAVNDSACALLPINSVLIAMYGGSGSIGKHSLLKFESTINQAVCAVLPNQKILPEFLHLYVEFYRPYWMVGAEGTRKDPNINQDTIRELVTPCPPKTEQAAIVAITKKSLSTIDSIIEQSESNIELMQERRTALISAAVTGKIDVRTWQAPTN